VPVVAVANVLVRYVAAASRGEPAPVGTAPEQGLD
jgi:hypothetical protein